MKLIVESSADTVDKLNECAAAAAAAVPTQLTHREETGKISSFAPLYSLSMTI